MSQLQKLTLITKTTTTVVKYYSNVIRRHKNDMMDHWIDDPDRKETQPKYISAISKEFIYVKPQVNQQVFTEKTVKFDFPGRDTLAISRTNKEKVNVINGKIQLKGVNTSDSKTMTTPEYEGIKDEDNIFCLVSLPPITQVGSGRREENFQFNRWWNGENPEVKTPIQGSNVREKLQNVSLITQELKVIDGKVQKEVPEVEQVEVVEITKEQVIINNRVLKPKTELNKIVLTLK